LKRIEFTDTSIPRDPSALSVAYDIIIRQFPQYVFTGEMYRRVRLPSDIRDGDQQRKAILQYEQPIQSFSKSLDYVKRSKRGRDQGVVIQQQSKGIDIISFFKENQLPIEFPEQQEVLAPLESNFKII
jgi:hypothetical protein